ncbi:MAG: HNH endonuclease [Enterobacter sp.]|uniref:HNH endonuclease n=1 Tax=Enterobacter sp. TaxID=42895 RepID=UPI002583C08B|nr:HNH endonuclease [Enterobacter sp.]MBS6388122.1 HNH endonuclease [Enterobacter sp.]
MHLYPFKIHNPVIYQGSALDAYKKYKAKKHSEKCSDDWNSDDPDITTLKKTIKDFYILEQDFTCCYCKQKIVVLHNGSWDAEHIIPKSEHPAFMFEPQNIAICCKDCNGEKLAKEVLTNSSVKNRKKFLTDKAAYLIVHPHFDEYDEHIEIRQNFRIYRGRTDKGVNTITICGLLRFGKDTNYSNVSSSTLDEVTEVQSRLAQAMNLDEQYALLLELSDVVEHKKAEVYKLRSERRNK